MCPTAPTILLGSRNQISPHILTLEPATANHLRLTRLHLGQDSFRNSVFHKMADLKGPTLTIVYLKSGHVFGGYASVPWTSGMRGR